ncbi:MAG TPA: hydroxylamine reductase [Candidatus Acidoferrales bacterium]|nr:hydroxylamine reductase [Candidatus Acidoferrales bacterium]
MFCFQCEQTSKGQGCQSQGSCGKDETTAALQDVLLYALKGVSQYAHRARQHGAISSKIDAFVTEAIFATLTNVNFDPERLAQLVAEAVTMREEAKRLYEQACAKRGVTPEVVQGPAQFTFAKGVDALLAQAEPASIPVRQLLSGTEVANLQEMITYGIKGVAAYVEHARQLGGEDAAIYAKVHEVLDFLTNPNPTSDALLTTALGVGELNLQVMEVLDRANTQAFGDPTPTTVRINPRKGKAILVSGHDLADLGALLEQTAGLGINIYTHGEMLPAHGYPKLKAYPHLAGNYGGAWQDQNAEFAAFPGAILMTSNCIQKPRTSYEDRIFTSGATAWPGVKHVDRKDFSLVIAAALAAPGFEEDGSDEEILVGFGHQAVLAAAPQVIEAVKKGAIRHFFLVGGCDGARSGRDYYTELAEKIPQDCLILTLACGKFRFNKMSFGTIGGLPRLLDIGQCNDAYSAIKIAVALAGAFNCGVNDLPLSMVLSWYEQKAVAILLTLLHLGIKNIRIGPSLPAFITPGVLALLQEKFNLMPITSAEEDLAAILN